MTQLSSLPSLPSLPSLLEQAETMPVIPASEFQYSDRSSLTNLLMTLLSKVPKVDAQTIVLDVAHLVEIDLRFAENEPTINEELAPGYSYRSYLPGADS